MRIAQLNHVALHVADVARSVAFYRDVLQLEMLPRPAFTFPGAWFRLGRDQELHLIGQRQEAVHSHHRGNHYALLVDDLDAWERHLTAHQASFLPRRQRPDGAWQLFVIDPDGHYIELCTPPPAAPPSAQCRHESETGD
jgi:catechol 2,3-dioxygenase-like lactoylglutathione lyase family enzyme